MKKPINKKTQSCYWSINYLQQFSLLTLFLLLGFGGSAQNLASWDFEGELVSATTVAPNVTATAAEFGPAVGGVSFPEGNGSIDSYSGNGWPTGGITADRYLQVTVETTDPCLELSVTGISFDERRSGTGPANLEVIWSAVDAFTPNQVYGGSLGTAIPDNTSWRTQTFMQTISDSKVIFRIYGYNAEGATGTWRFDNIEILGTVVENMEGPEVTCSEFTETFSYCPDFIGPNTSPDDTWTPLTGSGTFFSSAGGLFSQEVDVSGCVSDPGSDITTIEQSTIDSYEEDRTACSVTIVNEYAFRDACGNVADETVLVKFIFEDPGVDPDITCPADATVECGMSTEPDATGMATADDDCPADPAVTFSDSFTPGCSSGTGTITRTWRAQDECGGSVECIQLIDIIDTTPPNVSCAEFTTFFDGGCSASLSPNIPSGGFGPIPIDGIINLGIGLGTGASFDLNLNGCVSDDCTDGFAGLGIRLVSSTLGNATCGQTLTNTYDIRDACGNISPDLVTIVATFGDTEGPEVTCADFTMTFEGCPGFFGPNTPQPDPNDGWFSVGSNGMINRVFGGGNFALTLDVNDCLSDNCSDLADLEYRLASGYIESSVPGCSLTLVDELIIRDKCGNISENRIIVRGIIQNTSQTTINCPLNVDLNCGDSTDPANTGMATATDACGGVSVTFSDEITMRCNNGAYVIIRTWTAEGCGEPVSCEQFIFIRDEEAPEFDDACQTDFTFTTEEGNVCPTDATITLMEGDELTVNDTWTVGGNMVPSLAGCLSDNCALDEEITITVDDISITHAGGACARTVAVTFIADDGCGNDSEPFTLNYIFIDDTAPVFDLACQIDAVFTTEQGNVCPADATISLSEGDEIDVFTGWTVGGIAIDPLQGCVGDNCTNEADLTITVDDITVLDEGTCSRTITVTFIADDGCGNFSDPFVCNYTFLDNTAPEFDLACQIDAVFTTEQGNVCPADATISLSEGDEIDVFTGWTVGGIAIDPLQGCVGDNCTNEADLTITVDDITVLDEGTCSRTITVTFIADDGCGNFSDPFVCNYTFLDNTAPEFDLACQIDAVFTTEQGNVCPADATISLSEGDELTVFDGWTVGGIAIDPLQGCVGDNCTNEADLTITVDDITVLDEGTCSRTITVTFIADDGCGNFSDPFVCNYTFIDNTGPEVSFNGIPDGGTYVIECDLPSTTWDPLTDIGELTIMDNCSAIDVAGITEVLTQMYDGPCVGNVLTRWQQVFTVQDVCGNTTVYTLFTEIIDTTPPVFTDSPDDVTIECDETAAMPEMEAFDSCSEVVYGFTEVRTDGSCPNNYTLTRTWTATDGCGNASSEVQLVTVEDTTSPEIEFIDEFINQYEPGQDVFIACSEIDNILTVFAGNAVAADNCSGDVPVSYELTDLGFFDCAEFGYVAAYISTWKSIDECGNTATATINWFLVDETAPVLQGVPADACADANNLPPVAAVEARDNCEFAELSFNESDPIDCDGGQYIERTWTATDVCGNTVSATQRITLSGANGSSITIDYPGIENAMNGDLIQIPVDCDQNIDLAVAELEGAISVNGGCGSGESSISLSLIGDGNCQEDGYVARYQLSIIASDPCSGEDANLELTIDFVDQTPPVVSSPTAITLNCGDDIPLPTAEDACGAVGEITFVDNTTIAASCSSNPVAYEREWTVSDACGNATTFVQSITIIDNEGPVFSNVPADACNDTSLSDEPVTAFDTCTEEAVDVQLSEVMSNESGCGEVLTRTWTATDVCGNTSTAMQQVFFDDETAPEIVFNNDLLFGFESGDELFLNVGDGLGDPGDPLLFTADDVLVTDNCATLTAGVFINTTLSDDCAADGYLARYYYKFVAVDPCGNSSSIGLIVYYQDGNAPEIFNVPGDVEVYCSDVPAVAEVVISDDYDQDVEASFSETQTSTDEGVLITRTWTATDDCGNTNSLSQDILVVDNDLDATFSFASDVIECNSDNNRLGVTPSGGTAPYTYEWELTDPLEDGYITTDPAKPAILFTMGYITQTFTVNITDANGCEYAASVTVECDFSDDEGDFLIGGDNGSVGVNAYPNPTDQMFKVTFTEGTEQPATVGLYSLFGQELFRQTFQKWPQEGLEIDTQRLPNGTYLLRVEREGKAPVSREIVILH